ncbi:MAG: ATP-dependent DNA ligase [Acidobacteria bacterium]|nr:ATP-dependent DNA ligase [Acidobacteriota bacterium]
MLFASIVDTSRAVAGTSRRLEKTSRIAALLKQAAPEDVETAVSWLAGKTRQGRIGIGGAVLRDAAAPPAHSPALQVAEVNAALDTLEAVSGPGSDRRKRELLHGLMARATGAEQHFLAALLLGELRQGALEGIMLDALAKAFGVDLERVRRAVMTAGDIAAVARSLAESGAAGLDRHGLHLFRPVQPMLAQTAEDAAAALQELGEAALEYKFDGARVQVHRSGDDVRIFSRRLNEVTAAVPELVEAARALPARSFILDGEALSLTPDGRPQPFQITARRFGRKLDLDRMRADLPLTPYWFDLLYLDGGTLIDEPQARRFQALRELVPPAGIVPHTVTADPGRAAEFAREALARGHEGIMAKAVDAGYAAGSRGQSWLKIKQAHTLDLVILAAEWGHGRRHGWLSNLHLGARDTEKGGFVMLGKTFKGLTDETLAWQTAELLKIEIARDDWTVYVQPKLVVEIAFNDLQVSPRYPGGLALRFARVKRYRPDKSASEADTFETVRRLANLNA